MPLDEQALRKPGADGVSVVMADGQTWLVRRPRQLWMPDDNETGFTTAFDLGPEYDALVAVFNAEMTNSECWALYLKLFAYLLRLNYELTTDALREILRVDFGPMLRDDDDKPRNDGEIRFLELRDISLGREPAPKLSPAGLDSASSPTV